MNKCFCEDMEFKDRNTGLSVEIDDESIKIAHMQARCFIKNAMERNPDWKRDEDCLFEAARDVYKISISSIYEYKKNILQ